MDHTFEVQQACIWSMDNMECDVLVQEMWSSHSLLDLKDMIILFFVWSSNDVG